MALAARPDELLLLSGNYGPPAASSNTLAKQPSKSRQIKTGRGNSLVKKQKPAT